MAEATLPPNSVVRALEPLVPESCKEHMAAYELMGRPRDMPNAQVTWVTSMMCNGVCLTNSTWILVRNSGAPTYMAQVSTLFSIEHEGCKGNVKYFIGTDSCLVREVISHGNAPTIGNLVVNDEAWQSRVCSRVFSCYQLEVSELVQCRVGDSFRTFIMCP